MNAHPFEEFRKAERRFLANAKLNNNTREEDLNIFAKGYYKALIDTLDLDDQEREEKYILGDSELADHPVFDSEMYLRYQDLVDSKEPYYSKITPDMSDFRKLVNSEIAKANEIIKVKPQGLMADYQRKKLKILQLAKQKIDLHNDCLVLSFGQHYDKVLNGKKFSDIKLAFYDNYGINNLQNCIKKEAGVVGGNLGCIQNISYLESMRNLVNEMQNHPTVKYFKPLKAKHDALINEINVFLHYYKLVISANNGNLLAQKTLSDKFGVEYPKSNKPIKFRAIKEPKDIDPTENGKIFTQK